jgi:hypothetical protein
MKRTGVVRLARAFGEFAAGLAGVGDGIQGVAARQQRLRELNPEAVIFRRKELLPACNLKAHSRHQRPRWIYLQTQSA